MSGSMDVGGSHFLSYQCFGEGTSNVIVETAAGDKLTLTLNRQVNWHDGGIEGFATLITRYTDDQITILILSNQQDINVGLILQTMTNKIFSNQ